MPSYAKIIVHVRVLASTKTNIANICEVHNDFSKLRDYIAFKLCSKNIKCNQIQVMLYMDECIIYQHLTKLNKTICTN